MSTPASPAPDRGSAAAFLGPLRRTPPLVFAMAVLGVGLVTASAVAVKGLRRANDAITVTGASTERIRSDFADWMVVVSAGGASQQESWQALQPLVQRSRTWLQEQGIAAAELSLDPVRSDREEVRDPRTGELRSVSWTSRQTLRIASPDVDRIARVSAGIGSLIGEGIPLTIEEPAYTFTKLAEKRVDMLAKATRDARQRAVAIAREAGSGIGAITNADTGLFQITRPNSTDIGDGGSYDTRTIDKDITAIMGVTFRVE
ncbi:MULTISPECIES: SIMPL domain-containing protein [unclassified Synechococcus]|jgi:uncharacterized protein|uniref:SIMPL domain-containing protein n=1 Tax=unclassified Synechococcus TaxID=2626047 RepID=UPI001E533009|nr:MULTISPECIES: SIMPL domain-containing protein [unclassified Synechococcus]MEA5423247.1 SIMPL domain-containing protein [Synechococcus sp. CCY9202]